VASVAVLASGVGSNLQVLLDDPDIGSQVALVVSDRPEAPALERARGKGVKTVVLEPSGFENRASYDAALAALLEEEGTEIVVLAGFMRILGPEFVRPFAGRILNLHPALLPSFPGAHGIADALGWGVKVTGVTVHFVDEEVDHGPIIFQEAVPVLEGDMEDTLAERIHELEHRLLPAAVRAQAEGRLRIDGRIVHVKEEGTK